MSLRNSIVSVARIICRSPPLGFVLFHPAIRRRLQPLPGFRGIYGGGWDRLHPFDTLHGTQTGGYIPAENLPHSRFSDTKLHVYGGSQPSIVRAALRELPDLTGFTFLDLGAGKGRPALVASEFPFKEVVGVELAPQLVDVALDNVAIFRDRHPNCAPIRIENDDAAVYTPPVGDLVVFLYNPFGLEVMKRVVSNIEATVKGEGRRSIFVIYYNPVYGACFDASASFARYHARTIAYASDEIGFGPDDADPVVIWQAGSSVLPAKPGADATISITKPDFRCALIA
jgi:hypothetical protein